MKNLFRFLIAFIIVSIIGLKINGHDFWSFKIIAVFFLGMSIPKLEKSFLKLFTILVLLGCTGTIFAQKTKKDLDSLQTSLQFAKNDSAKAGTLREIGVTYVDMGNYPKGIEYFLQSKKLFESIKNEYGIFRCQNSLGIAYCFTGDYKTSLEYLIKCKKGIDDGILYDNLAFVYSQESDYPNALLYFKMSYDFYKDKSDNKLPRLLNDIGSMYEAEGKIDTAISYYNQCLAMATKTNDKLFVVDALASLGDIYFGLKNYPLALEYENKSLKIAREVNYLFSIRETERVLSDIYSAMGNPTKSLEHYKNHIAIRDSLVNEDNIKQVTRLEENLKFDKERELADEKLQHQKNQRNIFIGGFSVAILLSGFLFRLFKKNQKAKNIIAEQKKIVEEKKKEMTDNINYAQRIQKAILPSDEYIKNFFPENFILYKPKDIVSGDFYWAYSDANGDKYFATADCTGHGVSGAMMSMIGAQLLNEIVIERNIVRPDLILNALRNEIIKALNQEGASEERKDGMDISFCKLMPSRTSMGYRLEVACANNPIYIVRKGEIFEIKADRMPIGKYAGDDKLFTLNKADLEIGDILYTLSDGFCDQFGGEKGKKIMTKRFKEWVLECSKYDRMETKKSYLENRFCEWMGIKEQVDDVTIMAIKI